MNLRITGPASDRELAALVAVLAGVLNQAAKAPPSWRDTRRKALGMRRGA